MTVFVYDDMAVCQNLVPLVNIKIAGKWMFIPLKMYISIGIDPIPIYLTYLRLFVIILSSYTKTVIMTYETVC